MPSSGYVSLSIQPITVWNSTGDMMIVAVTDELLRDKPALDAYLKSKGWSLIGGRSASDSILLSGRLRIRDASSGREVQEP